MSDEKSRKPEQTTPSEAEKARTEAAAGALGADPAEAPTEPGQSHLKRPEDRNGASDGAGGDEAGSGDEDAGEDAEDPERRVAELEAELDELKRQLMYALAETENVRKRAERDRRDAEAYGGTRLARDLLSVHDNLERALGAVDEETRTKASGVFEGVELTHRELLSAFQKHRIEKLVPEKGDKFDPNHHQAMFEAPVPGATPGTVIEVMQAGFTIAGRLLRPALVGVAKAEATAEPRRAEG